MAKSKQNAKKQPAVKPADDAATAAPTGEPRPEPTDLGGGEMSCHQAAQAVGIGGDEVFAFRDHGTHVVVVTMDGRKLTDAKPAE